MTTTMTTTIIQEQEVVKGKSNLVRRVSDLFKADGNKSGPPSLFHHSSMQALRHCCQNFNLFPYLLYSLSKNSKEHPMPIKVNMCLALFVTRVTERIFRAYASIRQTIIRGLRLESMCFNSVVTATKKIVKSSPNVTLIETQRKSEGIIAAPTPKFEKFERQKPKRNPWFLKFAVYLAPLVLAFQLVGVFSLIAFGKYTPGFVFLVSALLFLGYISMKVLIHDTTSVQTFKGEKRKIE